ncbi:hypothetical protein BU23DRAFT_330568 [Bimuria novae-zelandiae CBS 107.79]|uniref:Fibroin-3 related protein n=1 Tax=Bimuria novae-zelandiae CBS 107.79 TaxID=1447943 RepID=A0A6A5UQP7_9PLEO|nr:hypothetical protein BU23DRAFT_330568 [Bimuria novae-zelandiae CBS 107.79]
MASLLAQRALVAARADTIGDIKDTLSSWDKCMAKNYCKWPVIVAIIIGGIIVLSVVLCVARCVCCGAEVACCCFKCCSCCCPSGGRKGHKRVKTPPPLPYNNLAYTSAPPAPIAPLDTRPLNQQYRSHAAPTFNPATAPSFNPSTNPAAPQFARFDTHSKPVNEDALPAMPSWKDAKSVQVEEEVIPEKRDDVEMDRLDHNGSMTGTSMAAVAAGGGVARTSPGPGRSPVQRMQTEDGYGYSQGYGNDPYAGGAPYRSPQGSAAGYGGSYGQRQDSYRGASPPQPSLSPLYGAGAGYAQNPLDRRSPGPGDYNRQPARQSPAPAYDQYDQQQQYGQPQSRKPPSLNTNNYGYGNANRYQEPMEVSPVSPSHGMYNNGYAAVSAPRRDPSPVYAPSGPAMVAPPIPSSSPSPAYPGQQTYGSAETSTYPTHQPYRAYTPAPAQDQQYSGVSRKPVEGSWKEI